jgi:hypothetical protein
MTNQNLNASPRRILRRGGKRSPKAAAPAVPTYAPLRRWSVAELILQATLLGRPATARPPGA